MKKILTMCLMALFVVSASAEGVQVKEKLNRAPVAVKTSQGILVSWRYLADDGDATFSVYRNNSLVKSGIADVTNYLDADGSAGDTYKVVSSKGGEATCKAWSSMYTTIELDRPAARKSITGNLTGRYRPDDISVGDVDGDSEYELIVKWFPDNQRDSGKDGIASATYIGCYEMDGTKKWMLDVGDGVRSGNHTTQFLVYDFDGDGKAEVIFKTAPDSKDGKGNYVTQAGDATIKAIAASTVSVNSKGRVTAGAEFLTVFNGETGEAMHTIFYSPGRSMVDFPNSDTSYSSSWGDSSYNRGERYNAAVAYLDGTNSLPSAIMQRGYYTACYIWAVDWNGSALKTRWLHKGTAKEKWSVVDAAGTELANETTNPVTSQSKSSYGQGVHGISIGDVNGDGKDDICIGAATIGSDGKLLCATGFGHGDAIHLADLCPDRPGLEVMMPHEETSSFGSYGYDVHDATTGEILASASYPSGTDNGRGLACDFIPANRGFEFWSSCPTEYNASTKTTTAKDNRTFDCATGNAVYEKMADTNFRIYWTGDPFDQTFDGRYDSGSETSAPRIRNWNTSSKSINLFQEFSEYGNPQACNTTKSTPCLQADLLGDWREEIIMTEYESDWSASKCKLHIYSTPEPTNYKVPCLMEDHMYRMGIAWQNSSYNQPPHLGYYLPDYLGVDGSTYTTSIKNHAPAADDFDPDAVNTEKVGEAEKDAVKVGTCYTTGENGEYPGGTSGSYVKFRTNRNNNKITLSVNKGYVIVGINIEGYSNNSSTTADRSIDMTGVYIDGATTSVLDATVTFPGGTAGQTPVSKKIEDFEATQNIVLTFDNSKIDSSDTAGKNAQIYAVITLYYKTSTGVEGIYSTEDAIMSKSKVIHDGKLYILKDGKEFNSAGQLVK